MTKIYEEIAIDTEVLEASPHRLIQMMLERCVQHINMSRHFMEANDIPKKCKAISKAMDIIAYLKLSLNMEEKAARELSERLDIVYTYIDKQLLTANLKNDPTYLNLALTHLMKIKNSWDAVKQHEKL